MGRPYTSELNKLAKTYSWAIDTEIDGLTRLVREAASLPLITVGSGGSFSAAHLAAHFHRSLIGPLSVATTPLEGTSLANLGNSSVLVVSAEGRNPDVLGLLTWASKCEPENLAILTAAVGSPLSRRAESFPWIKAIQLGVPTGKDGFIATNSLLATAVAITRAYLQLVQPNAKLPESLAALMDVEALSLKSQAVSHALARSTLLVLHGPTTSSAAIDLESKCSETGIAHVLLADYRSFAHGRHYWLAKNGADTGVVALVSEEDRVLAQRTLALLPKSIPVAPVILEHAGPVASLAALAAVLHVVSRISEIRGVDPGRPRVPTFGRKIYHLNAFVSSGTGRYLVPTGNIAVLRKMNAAQSLLKSSEDYQRWESYAAAFVAILRNAKFGGIIFDYDGTLCEPSRRMIGMRKELVGCPGAIATAQESSCKHRGYFQCVVWLSWVEHDVTTTLSIRQGQSTRPPSVGPSDPRL